MEMTGMTRNLREKWRTDSVEDFLKHVYLLEQQVAPVPTTLLAQSLNIAAPSVTDMIKRLSSPEEDQRERKEKPREAMPQLLDYEKYKGVHLTEAGRLIALEVIRHHRLLELYLTEVLRYSWDEVHEEAEELEHHISERLEARIAEALGNPIVDPHGDPIPALDGTILAPDLVLLSDLKVNQRGEISRIVEQTPEMLRLLSDLGLIPGTTVYVLGRAPENDTVNLRFGDTEASQTISTLVARKILVIAPEETAPSDS
jgi:DtxR family transcriptional regulator, Mn-dependent transcriptional regulator